jgi:hypothetical protein
MGPRLFRREHQYTESCLSRSYASIGPRFSRRGNFQVQLTRACISAGFNGATPFQTWKPYEIVAGAYHDASRGQLFDVETLVTSPPQPHTRHASMGPRLSDVEHPYQKYNKIQTQSLLQWGHSLSDWKQETSLIVTWTRRFNGPRFQTGNSSLLYGSAHSIDDSMGLAFQTGNKQKLR